VRLRPVGEIQSDIRSTICDGLYGLCTMDERSARAAELLSVRRNVMGRWLCGECLSLVQIGGGRVNVLFLSQRAGGYWVTSVVVEGSMTMRVMLVALEVVCDVGSELCVVERRSWQSCWSSLVLMIARESRKGSSTWSTRRIRTFVRTRVVS
jgi:hypothetical protein